MRIVLNQIIHLNTLNLHLNNKNQLKVVLNKSQLEILKHLNNKNLVEILKHLNNKNLLKVVLNKSKLEILKHLNNKNLVEILKHHRNQSQLVKEIIKHRKILRLEAKKELNQNKIKYVRHLSKQFILIPIWEN